MSTTNNELAKARAELRALCDVALLSSIHHVTYVSGFEVPHAVGVSAVTVYAGAFAALSVRDEAAWLGVSAGHAAQAKRESRLDGVLTFDSFDSFKPTDPRGTYL